LNAEQYAIAATALAVGLLTLFSMTKIWAEAFWKPMPGTATEHAAGVLLAPGQTQRLLVPIAALALLTVIIGLGAEFVFTLATGAAEQLLHREGYIRAVMGGAP
jgi:multicomponent Na+:H+ antiporter subunit D